MARNISANLITEKNSLNGRYPWLLLVELHYNDSGDTVRRFVRNHKELTYNGNLYKSFSFDVDLIRYKGGQLPSTSIRLSNVTRYLQQEIEDNEGLTGGEIVIVYVHNDNLAEDYAELTLNFDILFPKITARYVEFHIGGPSPLQQRFPLHRYYGDSCRLQFESPQCGYSRKTVAGVTLSGSDPVSIEVTGHGFETGDLIRLADINGVTPSLAGNYTITRTDDDNFTLDGTDSSDYSGPYTSGGSAGYAICYRIRSSCRERENETRFGGFPGLRQEGIRLA